MNIAQLILEELREFRAEVNARHDKIDERIRDVESWQSNANGKITIIGSLGVLMGGFFTWVVGIFYK